MAIPGMRGLGLVEAVKRTFTEFSQNNMPTFASALAYQALFSLFPFVLFLFALLAFLNLSDFFDWLQGQTSAMLPEQAAVTVNGVIDGLRKQQTGLLSVGVIGALWTASGAVRVLIGAMNVAYGVAEKRPIWKLFPLSIVYTIGMAFMLVLASAFLILGPQVMTWISELVGLESAFVIIWAWLRWPAAYFVMILAVAMIYYVAPNVKMKFRIITPGALLAVSVWILASVGFNIYVSNFGNYNAMYGSIGTVIILLLYLFISAAVLLLGAELNAVLEKHERAMLQQTME